LYFTITRRIPLDCRNDRKDEGRGKDEPVGTSLLIPCRIGTQGGWVFPKGYGAVGRWKGSIATRAAGRGRGGRAVGKGRVQSCAGQARSRDSPAANEITDQPTNQLNLALRASHGPVSVSTHVRTPCSDGTDNLAT